VLVELEVVVEVVEVVVDVLVVNAVVDVVKVVVVVVGNIVVVDVGGRVVVVEVVVVIEQSLSIILSQLSSIPLHISFEGLILLTQAP